MKFSLLFFVLLSNSALSSNTSEEMCLIERSVESSVFYCVDQKKRTTYVKEVEAYSENDLKKRLEKSGVFFVAGDEYYRSAYMALFKDAQRINKEKPKNCIAKIDSIPADKPSNLADLTIKEDSLRLGIKNLIEKSMSQARNKYGNSKVVHIPNIEKKSLSNLKVTVKMDAGAACTVNTYMLEGNDTYDMIDVNCSTTTEEGTVQIIQVTEQAKSTHRMFFKRYAGEHKLYVTD
jgi:hypothetical protein